MGDQGGKTSLQEIFSSGVCMFTCGPGPKTEVGSLSAFVEGVCLCRAGIQQYTDELRDCYVDRGPYFIECEENKQKCMQWLLHSVVHQRDTFDSTSNRYIQVFKHGEFYGLVEATNNQKLRSGYSFGYTGVKSLRWAKDTQGYSFQVYCPQR